MKNQQTNIVTSVLVVLVIIIVGYGVYYLIKPLTFSPPITVTTTPPVVVDTHGMVQYNDPDFGFSFWYPNSWQVLPTVKNDVASFPGGVLVKTLQVGSSGGVMIYVVTSNNQTITDEQNGHASPIAQTKYFYDSASAQWMVAYPESEVAGTTTANVSNRTMSGLVMLPSGRRFDTSIIPLNTRTFVVVSSGGGSNTSVLAKTVSLAGAQVDPVILSSTLEIEARSYTIPEPKPTPVPTPVVSGILPFKSGIHGTVMLGPTCPVMRNPPDPQCNDRPYQTSISVSYAKTPTKVFAKTKSDTDGAFTLSLPPGDYIISASGGTTLPRCSGASAVVGSSGYTDVQISCDTGIR